MDSFTETARPRAEYASKADYVAQRLLDRIVSADLAPGQTLGTEADLLSQYEVSRPTLRDQMSNWTVISSKAMQS